MADTEKIVVVSGLPRSGTSLVMAMLRAGGHPLLADDARPADDSNPKGYWEYAPVKSLADGAPWISQARGKAVKVVSPLLRHLPDTERYRVLLVQRPLGEVLASQAAMLRRQGRRPETDAAVEEACKAFAAHLETWLPDQRHFTVTPVAYHDILAEPRRTAAAIARFLDKSLDTEAMAAQVDPQLYRERR